MDHIPEDANTKSAQQVNRCRVFLQALTVSDIATPDGRSVDRNALKGTINNART